MDLVWLVYGISLLHGFGSMFIASIVISVSVMVVLLIYRGAECSQESWHGESECQKRAEKGKWVMGHVKTAFIVFITSSIMLTFLPSERTAYMMVGAYAAQKVAENQKVQETGGKVLNLINQKLDDYIDAGIEEAQNKATRHKRKE